jgi:aldehyde dehydrogenase (NAD+)
MKRYRNYVNGEWRDTATGRYAPNVNPARTDDVLGELPLSSRDETEEAIAAAEAALPGWRDTPAPERGRVIARVHRLMSERAGDLARSLTREEGKILREARGEVQKTLNVLEFVAGEGCGFRRHDASEIGHTFAYTVREPIGVVGAITPWNFPVAIRAGRSPRLWWRGTPSSSPASFTPETAEMVVSDVRRGGSLRRASWNLVYGAGGEVGSAIVEHPACARFRSRVRTTSGRPYARAASGGKKVQCEMGGKNPILVLEDADLGMAVEATAQGAFGSTGQRCTSTSRAVLVDAIADEFVERLAEKARTLVVGDGLDESVDMGPSVDEAQFRHGARVRGRPGREGRAVIGASRTGEEHRRVVLSRPRSSIVDRRRGSQEEIFGPVLSVIRWPTSRRGSTSATTPATWPLVDLHAGREQDLPVRARHRDGDHAREPRRWAASAQLPFGGTKATGRDAREWERPRSISTASGRPYIDYTGRKRRPCSIEGLRGDMKHEWGRSCRGHRGGHGGLSAPSSSTL